MIDSTASRLIIRTGLVLTLMLAVAACASLEVQYRENLDIPPDYGRSNVALERDVQTMVDRLATRHRLLCEVCDHIASGRVYRRKDGRHSLMFTANYDPRRTRLYYALEATDDKGMQKEAARLHQELSSEFRAKFPGIAVSQAGWTWHTVQIAVVKRPEPPEDYRLLYAQERLKRLRAEEAMLAADKPAVRAKPEPTQKPDESDKEFRKRKEREEQAHAKALKHEERGRDETAKDKDKAKPGVLPDVARKPEESDKEYRKRKERAEREYAERLKEQEHARRERDRVLKEAESVVTLLIKEREDARKAEQLRDYRLARSIVAETALKYGLRSRAASDAGDGRGAALYYAGRRFGTSDDFHELVIRVESADPRLATIAVKTYADDNADVQRDIAFEIKERLVRELGRERVDFNF